MPHNSTRIPYVACALLLMWLTGCGDRAGGVEIWQAVEQDNATDIAKYAAGGGNVNVRGSNGSYPLFAALEGEKRNAYAKLLDLGADPNIIFGGSAGRVVTNYAAAKPDPYWIRLALKHGGNPNLVNEGASELRHSSALEFAIHRGSLEGIKALVEAGADISTANENGITPLADALKHTRWDVVLFFLERGADYRVKDEIPPRTSTFLDLMESKPLRFYPQQADKDGISAIRNWLERHEIKLNYKD